MPIYAEMFETMRTWSVWNGARVAEVRGHGGAPPAIDHAR